MPQKGDKIPYSSPDGRKGERMRVRLQRMRDAQGYTQHAFATALGVSRSHYSQIESGDKNPSLKLAISIKKLLGYANDDLFDDTTFSLPVNAPK